MDLVRGRIGGVCFELTMLPPSTLRPIESQIVVPVVYRTVGLTFGQFGDKVVGDLLELSGLYRKELLELVNLIGEILRDIGHRS
jgi:hypothetical protein